MSDSEVSYLSLELRNFQYITESETSVTIRLNGNTFKIPKQFIVGGGETLGFSTVGNSALVLEIPFDTFFRLLLSESDNATSRIAVQ